MSLICFCWTHIYLEPNWPLFLKVNPPKRPFQSKQGSFGFALSTRDVYKHKNAKLKNSHTTIRDVSFVRNIFHFPTFKAFGDPSCKQHVPTWWSCMKFCWLIPCILPYSLLKKCHKQNWTNKGNSSRISPSLFVYLHLIPLELSWMAPRFQLIRLPKKISGMCVF